MTTNKVTETASKSYDLLSSNEYTFTYDDGTTEAPLNYAIDGNNLVATADIKYVIEATCTKAFTYDDLVYEQGKTYNFELKQLSASGNPELVGKYSWLGTSPLREMSAAEKAYWKNASKVGLVLDNTDLKYSSDTALADIENIPNSAGEAGTLGSVKVYQIINGDTDHKVDITKQYIAALGLSSTTTTQTIAEYSKKNKALFDAQGEYTYTFNNFVKESETSLLTINNEYMNQKEWTVKANDDHDFIGTRLNEVAESKSANETFNLGTGEDEITFGGDYGNDTVILNKGEELNLQLTGDYKTDIKGNDVVLSQNRVEYIAEADISGSLWGNDVPANTKYTFKLAKYVDNQYADSNLAQGENATILWRATTKYGTVDSQDRHWAIDNTLFKNALQSDGSCTLKEGGGTATNFRIYEVVNGVKTDITKKYVESLGTIPTTTENYDDSAARALYNAQNLIDNYGTITVKDFAKEEVGDLSINGDPNIYFNTERDSKGKFTGTRFNDTAISKEDKDTFDLKAGKDTIKLSGNFGDDTVKLSKDETAVLNYNWVNKFGAAVTNAEDLVTAEVKGSNLVLKTDVKYIAEAVAYGKAWGNDVATAEKPATYTFHLDTVQLSSDAAMPGSVDYKGLYVWKADQSYGKNADKKDCFISLTADDLTTVQTDGTIKITGIGGGATVEGLKIYEVINGEKRDITTQYANLLADDVDSKSDDLAKSLYNNQLSGSVTVENYTKKDSSSELKLSLNNDVEPLTTFTYQIESKKDVFTGTATDDVAVSTKENETFDLKAGSDKITFKGMFGDDTVKLTKGEILNLDFGTDTANIVKEIVGNDLVLSTDVKYVIEATCTKAFTYDDLVYEQGKTYNFELKQLSASGNPELVGKYSWLGTSPLREMSAAEKAYWKNASKVGLVLDNTDLKYSSDTALADIENIPNSAGAEKGTLGSVKVYQIINGDTDHKVDITKQYIAALDLSGTTTTQTIAEYSGTNEDLFKNQISGSVTVENFTKDTGATLVINNDYEHPYEYQNEIGGATGSDLNAAIVKGKITGTSVNDVINASSYVSANGTKGLTINTGSGNDVITGTLFNDNVTVKSLEGQTATVTEVNGTNKVNFGKGDDTFTTVAEDNQANVIPAYSSNTVNMGLGDNTAILTSLGTNKLTAGNGSNTVEASNGVNTIKLGNAVTYNIMDNIKGYAANDILLNGGINKVTTGKGVDEFSIVSGNNTINSGAGKDTFSIGGGYNVIKTGAGDKDFTAKNTVTGLYGITGGTNKITTGKGNDKFLVAGGNNIINAGAGNDLFNVEAAANTINTLTGGAGDDKFIVTANAALAGLNITLDGGAGNDIYDLSEFDYKNNQITIVDKKADKKVGNTIILDKKETVIFDVALKTDKKGNTIVKTKGNNVTSFTASKTLLFTADNVFTDGIDTSKGVKFDSAKNVVTNVKYGTTENSINYSNIATIAQNVANWLADSTKNTAGYTSAFEAFNSGTDVTTLAAFYTNSTGAYNA